MQFLLFWEEKFNASCTLKDKNFAPKQNERDCPMTGQKTSDAHFTRVSEVLLCLLALFWLYLRNFDR